MAGVTTKNNFMNSTNFERQVMYFGRDYRTGKNELIKITLRDYLCEFWSDETTTPNGVAPRLFSTQVEEMQENEEGDEIGLETTYQVRTWGVGGRGPSKLIETFESQDEADLFILECWHDSWVNDTGSDVPSIFFSKDEVEEFVLEQINDKVRNKISSTFCG